MFNRNLKFNSDLPTDKVIWLQEGEITPGQFGDWDITIAHGLQAMPFVKGVWTDDDWATTRITGSERTTEGMVADMSDVGSDATNVYFYGFTSAQNATIKYKLWGVWCENETKGKIAVFTKNASKNKFIINSDYNYPQLVREGYLERGKTLTHNLGFIPFCDLWAYMTIRENVKGYTQWARDTFGSIYGSGEYVKITDKTLSVSADASAPEKIYYRIYAS